MPLFNPPGGVPLPVSAASGGTGVANNVANTITITGSFSLGLTLTGNTAVTFPTSGTLAPVVTLTAGAGLTGGGDTSAARTFDVVAGTGITVNANDVALAAIADDRVLANVSGGSAAPAATTLTAVIDACIGATQGQVLYRNATVWTVLAPGTSGQVFTSGGPAANVSWTTVAGTGDVSAAAVIADNTVVRGDGGVKGVQASGVLIDDSANLSPVTNDVGDIGTTALRWGNAWYATGAVITIGDIALTHSAGVMTSTASWVFPAAGITVGASVPFSDAAGVLTLQNVDALDATTEATIEAAIDTLANLMNIQTRTFTLAGNVSIGGAFTTAGALSFPAVAQGDLFYGSGTSLVSALPKDATATRYLSNQGTANNPSWSQVDLPTGVTGNIQIANIASGAGASASTFLRGDNVWASPAGGGNVLGPGSATDNALPRMDGTSGTVIQNSGVIVSDTNAMTGLTQVVITGAGGAELAVGRQGLTNPTFSTNSSVASCVTGIQIISRAATAGVDLTVTSSGTNEPLTIDAKGSGVVNIAPGSTGVVRVHRDLQLDVSVSGTGVATQANMETGTATNLIVTPGRQHFHPGHPKAWGNATVSGGVPTLVTSHNVTGIVDDGVGQITFTIATDFSSANFSAIASSQGADGYVAVSASSAGAVNFRSLTAPATLVDPTEWNFAALGDHA